MSLLKKSDGHDVKFASKNQEVLIFADLNPTTGQCPGDILPVLLLVENTKQAPNYYTLVEKKLSTSSKLVLFSWKDVNWAHLSSKS